MARIMPSFLIFNFFMVLNFSSLTVLNKKNFRKKFHIFVAFFYKLRIISVTKVKESQIKSTFTLFNILKVKKNFQNPKIQVGFNRNKRG